ncbi:hypothetical protein [Nocardia sp. NPDC051832]|uniref:hypothetical protein n=1 Tax=Nocardia sp. NPDC051832 TaxID=3155673 RepID=UPI00342C57B6
MAAATVRLALVMLQQVTRYAARLGLIARDPAEYVEAFRQRPTKLTGHEVRMTTSVYNEGLAAAAAALFELRCLGKFLAS